MRHFHESGQPCVAMMVFSPGGHRRELQMAVRALSPRRVVNVSFPPAEPLSFDSPPEWQKTLLVAHPRRNPLRLLVNALQSVAMLFRYRPCVIISSGADVAVVPFLIGRWIMRRKTVFLESAGTVGPTLSGRLCYASTCLFLTQWPEQAAHYPRAVELEFPML